MGRIDKKEIDEELSHQRDILKRLRDNYRTLEKQEVSFGLSVPPHIVSEMSRLAERIQQITERIEHLEIQSVEEDYSLAEAEYRVMAAEAWENGYLTTLGMAQLELTRLRLQMPLEKAQQIQHEVRSSLVHDIFRTLNPADFHTLEDSLVRGEQRIYTAIRLDYKEFFRLLAQTKTYSDDLLEVIVKHMPALINNPLFQEETAITKQGMLEEIIKSKSEKLLTTWKKFIRIDP